jgi:hypothetical protein
MLADSLQKKPFFSSVTELATNRPAHKRHTDDWATPRPGTHETHHPEPSKQTKPTPCFLVDGNLGWAFRFLLYHYALRSQLSASTISFFFQTL